MIPLRAPPVRAGRPALHCCSRSAGLAPAMGRPPAPGRRSGRADDAARLGRGRRRAAEAAALGDRPSHQLGLASGEAVYAAAEFAVAESRLERHLGELAAPLLDWARA